MGKEGSEYDEENQPQNEKVLDVPCDDDKDDLESQYTAGAAAAKNETKSNTKQGFR